MQLLQMSLAGGVMIVVITVLRALAINKVPKKTFLLLWAAALLRLLVPFSLPSRLSIYSLLRQSAPVSAVHPSVTAALSAAPMAQEAAGQTAVKDIRSGVDACLGGGTGALRGIFHGGLLAVRAGIPDVAAGGAGI